MQESLKAYLRKLQNVKHAPQNYRSKDHD